MSYFNDLERLSALINQLLKGLGVTMQLFAYTLLLALPLGLIVALLRMSRVKPISWITQLYILVMRGTPLILQIFTIYFFLPSVVGYIDRLPATIIAFVLNYAAYFAEIYRGGIESMPVGQYEAAEVLGYGKARTFLRIILPQVIKRVIPPVTNEVITLVKDTSLACTVAYVEMFTIAKQISNSQTSFLPFVIGGAFYYVFNVFVAFVMNRIEHRLDYYR